MPTKQPARPQHHHAAPLSNLVASASSFVGRDLELARLASIFDDARLVTIRGPGGMGKTRLAMRYAEARVAARATEDADGVWFVDLTEARDAPTAWAAVAGVLGIELLGLGEAGAIEQAIGHGIAQLGRVLIVIDNFESVVDSIARSVERWVRMAPSARVLVTSRVELQIEGETVLALGPLAAADATELFIGRSKLVRPDDRPDLALVAELVDAVDRMPLAIELAATRTRVLSLPELIARLDRPLTVLRGGKTNHRHRSMRSSVLDSLALLSPSERRSFALASTLRNGFTVEDAEAVVGAPLGTGDDMLDALDALVRASLLRVSEPTQGRTRFAYFEVVRHVAEELARADPAQALIVSAHARHFARRAACADLDPDLELDNLLAAHRTAVRLATDEHDAERATDAFAIALGLESRLSTRGLSRRRADLFDGALAVLSRTDSGDDATRARAHLGRGLALRELGDTQGAGDDFEAALALARSAADDGLAALALTHLGGVSDVAGDTARARVQLREALALLAKTADDDTRASREAEAWMGLGHALRREGALEEATAAIEGSVARHRRLGNDEGLAAAMYELAVVALFDGRPDDVSRHLDEGLEVARRAGVRLMEAACMNARGCSRQDRGELDLALADHAEAARIFHQLGSRYREASALYYLASTYVERGEPGEACGIIGQAQALLETVGAPRYVALMGSGLASALALIDRGRDAEREIVEAERALTQVPNEPALSAAVAVHRLVVGVRAGQLDHDEALAVAEPLVHEAPSDDSRFALRVLRSAVLGPAEPSGSHALVVWPEASAFIAPGGDERVLLPDGSPLRRILEHLVTRRVETPGRATAIDEVIEVGWPDEKIGSDAALNRAYVALSTLRRKGLRDVIVRTGGGYALSRAIVVRRAD